MKCIKVFPVGLTKGRYLEELKDLVEGTLLLLAN